VPLRKEAGTESATGQGAGVRRCGDLVAGSTHTSSSRCRKSSASAESHRAGMGHELSMRRLTGASSMRIMVPMPHSGHSRRFFPVRAA